MSDDLDRRLTEVVPPWRDDNEFVGHWVEAIQAGYKLAYGERLNQLRGRYVKSFDDRGIHPFSEQIGRAKVCEHLAGIAGLEGVAIVPNELRRAGHEDADRDFRQQILSAAA